MSTNPLANRQCCTCRWHIPDMAQPCRIPTDALTAGGLSTHFVEFEFDPENPDCFQHETPEEFAVRMAAGDMFEALKGLMRSDNPPCWCDVATGNPMLRDHSPQCYSARGAYEKALIVSVKETEEAPEEEG